MKKTRLLLISTVIFSLLLSGCGLMITNPMEYMINKEPSFNEKESEPTDNVSDSSSSVTENSTENIPVVESSNNALTYDDMLDLSKELNDKLNKIENKGIILLHEGKSVEELCYFLSLTINSTKTLIVIPTSSDKESYPTEVNLAKQYINDSTTIINESNLLVVTKSTAHFDISDFKSLPQVDILYDYYGNDDSMLNNASLYDDGLVIISSMNNGSLSDAFVENINSNSILPPTVVVIDENNNLSTANKINNENVYYTNKHPYKAKMLLMLCLEAKYDSSKIKDIFER